MDDLMKAIEKMGIDGVSAQLQLLQKLKEPQVESPVDVLINTVQEAVDPQHSLTIISEN